MNIRFIIVKLYIFIFYVIIFINIKEDIIYEENITLIEMRNNFSESILYKNHIANHFVIFNINNKKNIKIFGSIFYIEHNSIYDDILFIIPLYSIIIKSIIIIICNDSGYKQKNNININKIKYLNYSTYYNCIYIDITFLKLLHVHSNIFRFSKYNNVYNNFKNGNIIIKYSRICKDYPYSYNYSIVTTVYKRNNLDKQIDLFINQLVPPKHIIIVHDRNIVNVSCNRNNILYYHAINFVAGFYFRYLISLLSPETDVVIYDDDWFPNSKYTHFNWIGNINSKLNGLYCHHNGGKNGIRWCATPLIVHRNWLYLMWYNKIFYEKAAEDGHLSFTLLLLCNIVCIRESIKGLEYKNDNLSSSKKYINNKLWNDYTLYIKNIINTSYIKDIKKKYFIY